MTTVRIEIHNEAAAGTFVTTVSGKNWQEEARTFIKAQAAAIRSAHAGVKVWALMHQSGTTLAAIRRIEV